MHLLDEADEFFVVRHHKASALFADWELEDEGTSSKDFERTRKEPAILEKLADPQVYFSSVLESSLLLWLVYNCHDKV